MPSWATGSRLGGREYGSPLPAELDALVVEARRLGVTLVLRDRGDTISLIAIEAETPGQGAGTKVMRRLVKYADVHCRAIELEVAAPTPRERARLRRYYRRFGFKPAVGHHAMERRPTCPRG